MWHSNLCQPMTKWYSLMWYPPILTHLLSPFFPLIPKKPSAGVQFVKPRIYQTGGGEWKSVNYENPEDLSLKQKLKMLGIDHEEGTKEHFHFVAPWWVSKMTRKCHQWLIDVSNDFNQVFYSIITRLFGVIVVFLNKFYCVFNHVYRWFKSEGC